MYHSPLSRSQLIRKRETRNRRDTVNGKPRRVARRRALPTKPSPLPTVTMTWELRSHMHTPHPTPFLFHPCRTSHHLCGPGKSSGNGFDVARGIFDAVVHGEECKAF